MFSKAKSTAFKIYAVMASAALMFTVSAFAKDIELNKDFSVFTSKNAAGYIKPLTTTLHESFNTNLFSSPLYSGGFNFALDISMMGMYIPNSQLVYSAELPEDYDNEYFTKTADLRDNVLRENVSVRITQPTIYGGTSNPVFSVPRNLDQRPDSLAKTVAFAEGNNINFMSGLPVIQLIFGLPTYTQIRARFLMFPSDDYPLYYYGFSLNQQIDRIFGLFDHDDSTGLALHAAYSMLSVGEGIDMNSLAVGFHLGRKWDNGFGWYLGAQYESLGGKFKAVRKATDDYTTVNSPYPEVRNGKPLEFDMESDNNYRLIGGLTYTLKALEFHFDAAYAAQPVLSCGITFWFVK